MEAALQPWSTNLLNSEYVSVQDLFQVWAQRWYRAVGMLRNSPWPCVWFKSANVPESSSSSQGFNLKGWAVSAREKLRQPLSFLGLLVYFKLMILFYTFTKALGQRFDIFSSHGPRFIFLQKSLLLLKRSSFLSDSLIYFFSRVLVNTL